MSIKNTESYDFEIPEEGLDYDILDMAFNPSTQAFIKVNGIEAGMRLLDVGSGSGIMTHHLASQVGPKGQVLSIDNSPQQLARAERYCLQKGDKNVSFKQLSVYELDSLNEHFDLIYCRFVLHHLQSPRKAITLFYQSLNKGGIYIAEEGIVSSAFAYPPSKAWFYSRPSMLPPTEENEEMDRDTEFGMKLFYWMKTLGFAIKDVKLIQPALINSEQKKKLLDGYDAYKKTALQQGKTEREWNEEREELLRLIKDDFTMVGFFQSAQVCGIK